MSDPSEKDTSPADAPAVAPTLGKLSPCSSPFFLPVLAAVVGDFDWNVYVTMFVY
jgi:cytochrome c biogenesis protein CcdA